MSDHQTDCTKFAPPRRLPWRGAAVAAWLMAGAALFGAAPTHAQSSAAAAADSQSTQAGGPIRLRQPGAATPPSTTLPAPAAPAAPVTPAKVVPSEFEAFVQRLAQPLETRRFGAELLAPALETHRFGSEMMTPTDDVAETLPLVPADEVIRRDGAHVAGQAV